MDPLSMTASIIAILQLTSTLTGYINDVRKATKEQAQVAIELGNLFGLLTSLRFRVDEARTDEAWFNHVKLLALKNGPLDQFKDILEKMVEQIAPATRKRDQIKAALIWPMSKSEIDNALERMERLKSLIHHALTNDLIALSQATHSTVITVREDIRRIDRRVEAHVDGEMQHRISDWLGLPDPSTNYRSALKKRHAETGKWLLDGQHFQDWKASLSSFMWLHGSPGCGKTVLSAAALQSILKYQESRSDITVSYFYFDFNDAEKQSSKKAIRSLLFQSARQTTNGLAALEQLYHQCGNGQQQPAEDTIRSILRDVLDGPEQNFIMLDALDECLDREEFSIFLKDLAQSQSPGLHVLAMSRREGEIEKYLAPTAQFNIDIQSAIVDQDIRVYVSDRLATDPKLKKWPPLIQQEITSVLLQKAGGMFRWVFCQLESIRSCIKLGQLRTALASLPKTLDETYERILRCLEDQGQLEDALKALRWLCYSNRPMRLSEMIEVLAIQNGDGGGFFPEERLPAPADIMVVCSSLISFSPIQNYSREYEDDYLSEEEDEYLTEDDDESSAGGIGNLTGKAIDATTQRSDRIEVRLAHFSVKEFLLSDRSTFRSEFLPQLCHTEITKDCLHYLLHVCKLAPLAEDIVNQYPLAQYVAKYWWQHAKCVDGTHNNDIIDLAAQLLTDNDSMLLSWVQLFDIDKHWKDPDFKRSVDSVAPPLYYATSVGFSDMVGVYLQQNVDINAKGGEFGNALQAASYHGHDKIVQMLLDKGAEINAQGGKYGSALQAASYHGHEKVEQMLLDRGAEVNAQGGFFGYALQAASYHGHEKIIQMLLDTGAEINSQGGEYGSALQAASARGHKKIVQTLLDRGAEVNAQGGYYGSALQAACASWSARDKVVQILLDRGAEVNAQGGRYGSALQAASARGHEKIVQMLLDAGAQDCEVNPR